MPEPITLSSHTAARRSAKSRRRRAASNAANQADDADAADNADNADAANNADHAATRSRVPHAGDHRPRVHFSRRPTGCSKPSKVLPVDTRALLADNPKAGQKTKRNTTMLWFVSAAWPPAPSPSESTSSPAPCRSPIQLRPRVPRARQLAALAAAAPPYLVAPSARRPSRRSSSPPTPATSSAPGPSVCRRNHFRRRPRRSEVPNDPIFMPYAIDCSRLVQLLAPIRDADRTCRHHRRRHRRRSTQQHRRSAHPPLQNVAAPPMSAATNDLHRRLHHRRSHGV